MDTRSEVDNSKQSLTARNLIRAHTYPVLAALSSLSLLAICLLLIPQALYHHRYNRCIDVQIQMRSAINPQGGRDPGKIHYLKAVQHCEGG